MFLLKPARWSMRLLPLKEMTHNKRKNTLQLSRESHFALLGNGSSVTSIHKAFRMVNRDLSARGIDLSLPSTLKLDRELDTHTNYGKLLEYIDVKLGEETHQWLTVNPFALIVHSALKQPKFAKLLHDSLNGATASLVFYTDGFNGGDPLKSNANAKLMNAVLQRMINIFTPSLLSIYIYIYII